MNLEFMHPNLVEVSVPISPGDKLRGRRVFEVRRLGSTCTVAGRARPLFVAVHEKDRDHGVMTMFVCFGRQKSWVETSPPKKGPAKTIEDLPVVHMHDEDDCWCEASDPVAAYNAAVARSRKR